MYLNPNITLSSPWKMVAEYSLIVRSLLLVEFLMKLCYLNKIKLQAVKFVAVSIWRHWLFLCNSLTNLGLYSRRRCRLISIGISIINQRHCDDRLRFIMAIPIQFNGDLLVNRDPSIAFSIKSCNHSSCFNWTYYGLVIKVFVIKCDAMK